MARVLFAWELGDNYGHLSSFSAVAGRLVERGHEVVAVVQNVVAAAAFLPPERVRCLQAPLWRPRVAQRRPSLPALTYADSIRDFGYDDPAGLSMLVRAWRELLRLVSPDVLVHDAAPTALLGARGLRLRRVGHATGYSLPPQRSPLPSLRPWDESVTEAARREREAPVLETVNDALRRCELPPLASLGALFDADLDLLRTVPELDHYPDREAAPARTLYAGPAYSLDAGAEVEWPAGDGPRIFAYLRPGSTHFEPTMEALLAVARGPARVVVAAPGLPREATRRWRGPRLRVIGQGVRLRALRTSCELAVHHGGHGTAAAFALAGVPQLLLPNRLEQLLVARRLQAAEAGLVPAPGAAPSYRHLVDEALGSARLRRGAQALAARYPDMTLEGQTEVVVEALERLV